MVELEPLLPQAPNADLHSTRQRADIRVTEGGQTTYLDVSIVSPSSRSALQHNSDTTLLAGATLMERAKTQTYAQFMTRMGLPASALVPFVLETSGRAGNAALAFLQRLNEQHDNDENTQHRRNERASEAKQATKALTAISTVVWRANCRLLQAMAALAPRLSYGNAPRLTAQRAHDRTPTQSAGASGDA